MITRFQASSTSINRCPGRFSSPDMPRAGSHLLRNQFTKDLNAASSESSSHQSVEAVVGCSVGVLLLLIMGFCIWYERRLKRKKNNEGLDVVTLQKQNESRFRALRSLLPANPNDGENKDWRPKTLLAHPIWREYRRRVEVKLHAEGYSETAIQLASESGYEDSILPDASATQSVERTCIPAARIQEYTYTSQQIQEVARQRDFAYPVPASEATTAGSLTDLSQEALSTISQASSQPANRFRFSQWLMHRVHAGARNGGLATLCPQTSPSHKRPNRSEPFTFLSRLSPRTSKHSRNTSNSSSVPAGQVPRFGEYTANDRIHYMVRIASEERRKMQQGVSDRQNSLHSDFRNY